MDLQNQHQIRLKTELAQLESEDLEEFLKLRNALSPDELDNLEEPNNLVGINSMYNALQEYKSHLALRQSQPPEAETVPDVLGQK